MHSQSPTLSRQFCLAAAGLVLAFPLQSQPDAALQPPPVRISPASPEYGSAGRAYQGIPGIERAPKGRLWSTWYAAGPHARKNKTSWEGPYNFVVLVTSGDDGKTWSGPEVAIDPPGLVRAFDPTLWLDPNGTLWLFWAQSAAGQWDGRGGVWAIATQDPDSAHPRWSAPRRIANGVMMNKPVALKTGEWLFPIGGWQMAPNNARYNSRLELGLTDAEVKASEQDIGSEKAANVFVTRDGGKTFSLLGQAEIPAADWAFNEHMIVERGDRGLLMLVRTKYGIGESVSSDRGRTWTLVRNSGIPHPSSRFFVRRLASGKMLLVRHNPPGRSVRSHLTAFLSADDGRTWQGGLLLDERTGVSYPDGIQTETGTLYIAYDRNRETDREILFATFTEDDVRQGQCSSPACRLKAIIDRPGPREEK